MNDPHVEALHYKITHGPTVDYDRAPSMAHDEPGFTVKIENDLAEITFIAHYATADAARNEVEPFLRAWELSAALELGLGQIGFHYERASIIDRNPNPERTIFAAVGFASANTVATAHSHVSRVSYPSPPVGLMRDADVEVMFACYEQHLTGKRTLADAAYFCLTVLGKNNGRRGAAARYAIHKNVLDKMGDLTTNKGGPEARKFRGAHTAFTSAEQRWLEEAMKKLIRRAAEVAHDPSAVRRAITLADLPSLP